MNEQRDLRIDTLRGLLLVIITINHFGLSLSEQWWAIRFTWQPLGHVSAAEGFVLLAGFVFATVYARYGNDLALLWQKARQRAFDIYTYHLVLLLGLALCSFFIPAYRTVWIKWLSPYHQTPVTSTVASALLLHQPPYLDILPLYTLCVLASPVVLYLLFRRKAVLVLAGSFVLWGLGQVFDPMGATTHFFAHGHRPAYFNILSWQLLYVLGLYLGYKYHRNESLHFLAYKPVVGFIVCCAVALFLSRHAILLPEITMGLGRPRLEWLRLANVLLLAATIGSFLPKIPLYAQVPWLAFLGKHSLQVFSFHIALLYLLAPVTARVAGTLNTTWFTMFVAGTVLCLSVPASLRSRYREWLLAPEPAGPASAPVA